MISSKYRRSTRLRSHDYCAAGAYFITLCTQDKSPLFGDVRNGKMQLSRMGEIVHEEWQRTQSIRAEVELDVFQIMPDHFHAIVFLHEQGEQASIAPGTPARNGLHRKPRSLGSLVAGFKCIASKRINGLRRTPGVRVWQRNYYDRIIRSPRALEMVRRYVRLNPRRWRG